MFNVVRLWEWLWQTEGYPPRNECLGAMPEWMRRSVAASDLRVALAYFAMPVVMGFVWYRRPKLVPWQIMFGYMVFIFSCGAGHYFDYVVWTDPIYNVYFVNRWITGYVSWFVLFTLPFIWLRVRKFRSSEEYHKIADQAHQHSLKAELLRRQAEIRAEELRIQLVSMESRLAEARAALLHKERLDEHDREVLGTINELQTLKNAMGKETPRSGA